MNRARHRRLAIESLEPKRLLTTFLVTTSDDSGRGSLREAILLANESPGKDLIEFSFQDLVRADLPGSVSYNPLGDTTSNVGRYDYDFSTESGLIRPRTPLPEITDPVIIDGTLEGFSLLPAAGVEIRGDRVGNSESAGLRIASDDVEIRGLIITSFPSAAIELRNSRFGIVAGNFIGSVPDSSDSSENEFGISLINSSDNKFFDNAILGNSLFGVSIYRDSDRNVFHRNLVAENSVGFFVQGFQNRIGGDGNGEGNLIANHFATGVDISGTSDGGGDRTWVQGNVIVGNAGGVDVRGGADSVIIGGANAEALNIISANGSGIFVSGNETSVTIRNNHIGTNLAGDSTRFDNGNHTGNVTAGIEIAGSSEHDIRGNVIGGNNSPRLSSRFVGFFEDSLRYATPAAVLVHGGSSDIQIRENFIGVGKEDGVRLLNYGDGVSIVDSSEILVENNVISGSRNVFDALPEDSESGIGLLLRNSEEINVTGNRIGTNSTGLAPVPNQLAGILVLDSSANQIGGLESGDGNLVSGNQGTGIAVLGEHSDRNRIQGNRIGTDADGLFAIPNQGFGIVSASPETLIGGPGLGEGNLVSGNRGSGIRIIGIDSVGTAIQGNRVGTDVSGLAGIPNDLGGIELNFTENVIVGGSQQRAGNKIAFNGGNGIDVWSGRLNTIEGNEIVSNNRNGVFIEGPAGFSSSDPASVGNRVFGNEVGKVGQGNGRFGIRVLYGPRSEIGGPDPGEGNAINGNGLAGVQVESSDASQIVGNGIRSNLSAGVLIRSSQDVDLDRNSIGGNGSSGIGLYDSSGAEIYRNEIAVNDGDGITIAQQSSFATIGSYNAGPSLDDADTGEGNIIRDNDGAGVWIAAGRGHTLTGNSIHSNATMGIDIGVLGVDPIDSFDEDREGPNELQNAPELESIVVSEAGTRIQGTLTTSRNSPAIVQFFFNPTPSLNGNGQGRDLIHEFEAISDSDGIIEIDFTLEQILPPGSTVAATATVESGFFEPGPFPIETFFNNTSEFSNFVQIPFSETQVNTRVGGNQSGQDVAVAGDGSYVVAWAGPDDAGESTTVEFRRFASNGVPIDETPIQVNTKPGRFVRDRVSVAMNHQGEFVVAWMDQTPDDPDHYSNLSEIYYRRFDADGNALDDVQHQANTIELGQQAQPSVGMSGDGGFVIVWESGDELGGGRPPGDGDYRGIFARRFAPDGTALDLTEFQVNQISEGDQAYPVIDVTPLGSFVVAWTDDLGGGFRDVALARVYNPDGTIRTNTFRINRNAIWMDNFRSTVDVALTDAGSLVATWIDAETQRPMFQRFTSAGLPIVSIDINVSARRAAWGSRVDSDEVGNFSITWATPNTHPNGIDDDLVDVFVRDFSADGGSAIVERRVHDVRRDWQYAPQIAINRTGDYALAWLSNGQDGDRSGVYSRTSNPRPDIAVQQFIAGGESEVTLRYRIDSRAIEPFDIEVVLATPPNGSEDSGDQVTLSTLRIDEAEDLQPGEHEKVFAIGDGQGQVALPGFGSPTVDEDYEILLIADPADRLLERDRDSFIEDNTVALHGVYRSPDGQLFVHGDARPDNVQVESGSIVVLLGGRRYEYGNDQVSSIQVRSQGGDDRIIADLDINKPLFGWGGPGDDHLVGGSGSDFLRGGPGDDVIRGGPGNDFVDGEQGNDVLDGGTGSDVVRDDSGTNRFSDPENDRPESAYLRLSLNRSEVTEGDARSPVRLTVTRLNSELDEVLSLELQSDQDQWIGLPGRIDIPVGSDRITVDVSIRDDTSETADKQVRIDAVAEGYLSSGVSLTIVDDDPRPDPLLVIGGGTELNLADADAAMIRGIDAIDIRGFDAFDSNRLILDATKFTDELLGSGLTIYADQNDRVEFDIGWTFDGFRVFAGQRERQFSNGSATVWMYGPTDFTNPIDPYDVDGSGTVSPLDALLVIGQIADSLDGTLPPVDGFEGSDLIDAPPRPMSFYDVTADSRVSPLDALLVITEIVRLQNEREGEFAMPDRLTLTSVPSMFPSMSGEENRSDGLATWVNPQIVATPIDRDARSWVAYQFNWRREPPITMRERVDDDVDARLNDLALNRFLDDSLHGNSPIKSA